MAKAAVLITYREIFKKEPDLSELHKILKEYERREVIFLLAKLNILLGTWQNTPQFELDQRLSTYLLGGLQNELRETRGSSLSRVVFSRLTLLYVMKQACIACPEKGSQLNTRKAHSEMGVCCLMANDLLLPFIPSPSDGLLERLTNLLPFADYVSHGNYPMEIGRTKLIFDEVSKLQPLAARADFIDLLASFQNHLGLDASIFCELCFGCSSKFLNIKLEELEANPELAVLRRNTFFSKSQVPNEQATHFFQKLTISEPDFVKKVNESKERPANDLTIFQAFPLVEIANDVFVCLDPGFLVDKAGRSLYWTLFFQIPEDQRGKLASFWGAVFESYVNYVLEKSYSAGGKFLPDPRFPNGDASFDACILEGRNLLVLEHKSSVIRADAKYSGDPAKLKKELDLKFIEGEADGAKGLTQISKHLYRFFNGEKLGDLSSADVDRVFPIMVCLENTMVVPYVGRYLNEQFREMLPRRGFRQVVTPVFILGAPDIENLLGYLQSYALSEILESYYSKNRSLTTSISTSEVPILKNKKPGQNIVMERFSNFSETAIQHLFGDDVP